MKPSVHQVLLDYYDVWLGTNAVYEQWAKKRGFHANTVFALQLIECLPNCTAHLIGEKLSLPKQTVSSLLNPLIKNGTIVKIPNAVDHRSQILEIAEDHKPQITALLNELYEFEADAIAHLSEAEQQTMIKTGKTFLIHLKAALKK